MLLVLSACGALSLSCGAETASSSSSSLSASDSSSTTVSTDGLVHHRRTSYRVEKGDTAGSVAHQFHCSVAALKKLNGLTRSRLKTGLVLDLPAGSYEAEAPSRSAHGKASSSSVASDKSAKTSRHHLHKAQPVQDFDISPSTFASCPVPAGSDETADTFTPSGPVSGAVADLPPPLVAKEHRASLLPVPNVASAPVPAPAEAPGSETAFTARRQDAPPSAARPLPSPVLAPAAPRSSFASAIANFFGGSHSSESGEWGNRFLTEARNLAGRGIGYDGSWRPAGESHAWEMDCSNTSRYLYQVTAGIQLPRTASDQYYYLHLQDKAWDVPMTSRGFADCNYLRSNLKPGDLLFWENTYRPERQPPITHVMIYLGTDSQGRWLMAGSQSGRHGLYNPHRNGPDVYVFNPTQYSGGYTTWLGLVHHHGRFVAYGRPLEADVKKLAVAAND